MVLVCTSRAFRSKWIFSHARVTDNSVIGDGIQPLSLEQRNEMRSTVGLEHSATCYTVLARRSKAQKRSSIANLTHPELQKPGTLSSVFLGAACMCTVPANKELTTTHGFAANLTLSSSGTRGARPDYSAKYSCSTAAAILHVPPTDVRDTSDVPDMTSHVVNFHEFLVEAAVHELTIHSKCSSDTVRAKRH